MSSTGAAAVSAVAARARATCGHAPHKRQRQASPSTTPDGDSRPLKRAAPYACGCDAGGEAAGARCSCEHSCRPHVGRRCGLDQAQIKGSTFSSASEARPPGGDTAAAGPPGIRPAARAFHGDVLEGLAQWRAKEAALEASPARIWAVQIDTTRSMRALLVDWMYEVADELRESSNTFFLAVNYLDRFLVTEAVARGELQLLGMACLWLAAKYEEVHPPTGPEMTEMAGGVYSPSQLCGMELRLLKTLRFDLGAVTPAAFLDGYLCVMGVDDARVRLSALQILEQATLLQADNGACNVAPGCEAGVMVAAKTLVAASMPEAAPRCVGADTVWRRRAAVAAAVVPVSAPPALSLCVQPQCTKRARSDSDDEDISLAGCDGTDAVGLRDTLAPVTPEVPHPKQQLPHVVSEQSLGKASMLLLGSSRPTIAPHLVAGGAAALSRGPSKAASSVPATGDAVLPSQAAAGALLAALTACACDTLVLRMCVVRVAHASGFDAPTLLATAQHLQSLLARLAAGPRRCAMARAHAAQMFSLEESCDCGE